MDSNLAFSGLARVFISGSVTDPVDPVDCYRFHFAVSDVSVCIGDGPDREVVTGLGKIFSTLSNINVNGSGLTLD